MKNTYIPPMTHSENITPHQKYEAVFDDICKKIDKLKSELSEYEVERQEVTAFIEKIIEMDRKFAAIQETPKQSQLTFLPSAKPATKPPILSSEEKKNTTPKIKWTETVLLIVTSKNKGVEYDELKDAIKLTSLAIKMENSPKSFYGAIEKLVSSQRITKYGARLYSLQAFEQFKQDVANGIIKDDITKRNHRGGGKISLLGGTIKDFLGSNSQGITGKELRQAMIATGEQFVESVEKHHSYLYNVISTLIKRGEVTKMGKKYYLAD